MSLSLVEILEKYDLSNPLCGTDKMSVHCYIEQFYEEKFAKYKDLPISLLELGISNGACFKLWREYFVNAENIIGVDNRPHVVDVKFKSIPGVTF